jgi:multidrug transporter EmrE-like cation transporter|tara:strand:- start:3147 stop:3464 length:318 start_codon:yes stop_codon:yes gene_type:complete
MNFKTIQILIGIVGLESLAQYFLQKQVKSTNMLYLIGGSICYSCVALGYYLILKSGVKMALADAFFNAGSQLMITIIGFFIFGQRLNYKQMLGIIFILIGVKLAI